MRKVIRDNKVAVILGNRWYTSNKVLEWAFLPELVELIESVAYQDMTEEKSYFYREKKQQMVIDCLLKVGYQFTEKDLDINNYLRESDIDTLSNIEISEPVVIADKYLNNKLINGDNLYIEWADCNRDFSIDYSDYGEYIIYKDNIKWLNIDEKDN